MELGKRSSRRRRSLSFPPHFAAAAARLVAMVGRGSVGWLAVVTLIKGRGRHSATGWKRKLGHAYLFLSLIHILFFSLIRRIRS